jgi:hypothetical protein
MSATISTPPWIKKPREKDFWIPAKIAAREWFRKSHEHIVRLCKAGEFKDVYETFFDGSRWWIKLPEKLPKSAIKKTRERVDGADTICRAHLACP